MLQPRHGQHFPRSIKHGQRFSQLEVRPSSQTSHSFYTSRDLSQVVPAMNMQPVGAVAAKDTGAQHVHRLHQHDVVRKESLPPNSMGTKQGASEVKTKKASRKHRYAQAAATSAAKSAVQLMTRKP